MSDGVRGLNKHSVTDGWTGWRRRKIRQEMIKGAHVHAHILTVTVDGRMVPSPVDGWAVDAGVVGTDVRGITVVSGLVQSVGAVDIDKGGVRLVAGVWAVHCNTRNFFCVEYVVVQAEVNARGARHVVINPVFNWMISDCIGTYTVVYRSVFCLTFWRFLPCTVSSQAQTSMDSKQCCQTKRSSSRGLFNMVGD